MTRRMHYLWLEGPQSIKYDVLHYMERGACQSCHVVRMSAKTTRPRTASQVRSAMQGLRRDGLIEHDGRWVFVNPALRAIQFQEDGAPAQKGNP